MALTSYLTVIFVMSFFAVSKLFGPKIPKTNSWINEFIRQMLTMPNFFWVALTMGMGISFMLNWLLGPEMGEYYQMYVAAVVSALSAPLFVWHQKRTKKNKKKRRIIRAL